MECCLLSSLICPPLLSALIPPLSYSPSPPPLLCLSLPPRSSQSSRLATEEKQQSALQRTMAREYEWIQQKAKGQQKKGKVRGSGPSRGDQEGVHVVQ